MKILDFITKLYQNKNFIKYFLIALGIIVLLMIIVIVAYIKDKKKKYETLEELEEDVKDISFELPKEFNQIREDITFEMPVLTKNLDDFRKSIEEEIKGENPENQPKIYVKRKKKNSNNRELILDRQAIEDTMILDRKEFDEALKPSSNDDNNKS